eukprot:TRINITY_DN38399_c0_g1_i3.p1 TRINITY_DN38399_c0_g1~~TRINITY_DN38399_c0_g1_i3.p1  ORF type:complete len:502 (+),score=68.79 TRINITY_DN38399_c0_g1_i3:108-1613(+)
MMAVAALSTPPGGHVLASPLAQRGVPLKQYEVALQNAQRVLAGLLDMPARPWQCFPGLVRQLVEQASALSARAAACRIQRCFRQWFARRSVLPKAPQGVQTLTPSAKPQTAPSLTGMGGLFASAAAASATRRAATAPKAPTATVAHAAAPKATVAFTAPSSSYPSDVNRDEESLASAAHAACTVAKAPAASVDGGEKSSPPSTKKSAVAANALMLASSTEGGTKALNPIEKRRQMVASQLAVANPSRLARSRKRDLLLRSGTPTSGGTPPAAASLASKNALTGPEAIVATAAEPPSTGVAKSPGLSLVAEAAVVKKEVEEDGRDTAFVLKPRVPGKCGEAAHEFTVDAWSSGPLPRPSIPPVENGGSVATPRALGGEELLCIEATPPSDDPLEAVCRAGISMSAGFSMAPPSAILRTSSQSGSRSQPSSVPTPPAMPPPATSARRRTPSPAVARRACTTVTGAPSPRTRNDEADMRGRPVLPTPHRPAVALGPYAALPAST